MRIGVVSPFDIWCAGLESVLGRRGHKVADRWRDLETLREDVTLSEIELLVVSRCLIPPSGRRDFRPLEDVYSGKMVLVVDPRDEFSTSDFVGLNVDAIMLSTCSLADVADCLASISGGRRWVDPDIRFLLGQTERSAPDYSELSYREKQVADLAATGMSNKEIARQLSVADGTVKMHMHHILGKLNLSSRIELVGLPQDFAPELGDR